MNPLGFTLRSRSSVIEYLKAQGDRTTVYHYCDFGDSRSTSPPTVLRSLLIQLLSSTVDWLGDFGDLVARSKRKEGPPTKLSELVELIKRASKRCSSVFAVIDALDECKPSDREGLLNSLRNLTEQSNISLFLTSRKEHDIFQVFHSIPAISLGDQKGRNIDITNFVFNQLQDRRRLSRYPAEVKKEILRVLVEKADGM